MPPDDLTRLTLGLAALAGGAVWGLYDLATSLFGGQPVPRQVVIGAAINVACGIISGALVAGYVGPLILSKLPAGDLRDPHAVGFVIGGLTWEAIPFLLKGLRRWAARKAEGGAP